MKMVCNASNGFSTVCTKVRQNLNTNASIAKKNRMPKMSGKLTIMYDILRNQAQFLEYYCALTHDILGAKVS